MDIDKRAKELLLGHSCQNCGLLEHDASYPPIRETELNGVYQKYQPRSMIINLYCKYEKNIQDYENYVCEHWQEGKNSFAFVNRII